MSIPFQSCVNLGIAEPPVNLGTAERVAVHGENYTLHFVRIALVLEPHVHVLFLQISGKHVPVAAP
ncbi:hypothetical protein [uncultured Bacteroides sp.]|uniref:hypothetical protein n=1 Tax=uncultured Bacteroides sp. TaxID=162156 RepID=UPI00338FD521